MQRECLSHACTTIVFEKHINFYFIVSYLEGKGPQNLSYIEFDSHKTKIILLEFILLMVKGVKRFWGNWNKMNAFYVRT